MIQKLQSDAAASVHRTLLGAFDGRPLRSTKLGEMTNAVLSAHGCPNSQYMRHVREHFSTELALELADMSKVEAQKVSAHIHGIAATSSNHDVKTAMNTYAGVFERNRQIRCLNSVGTCNVKHFCSVGGLRHVEAREKMLFSRTFNEVVLGFLPENGSLDLHVITHETLWLFSFNIYK